MKITVFLFPVCNKSKFCQLRQCPPLTFMIDFRTIKSIALTVIYLLILHFICIPTGIIVIDNLTIGYTIRRISMNNSIDNTLILFFEKQIPVIAHTIPVTFHRTVFFENAHIILTDRVSKVLITADGLCHPDVFSLITVSYGPYVHIIIKQGIFVYHLPSFVTCQRIILGRIKRLITCNSLCNVRDRLWFKYIRISSLNHDRHTGHRPGSHSNIYLRQQCFSSSI